MEANAFKEAEAEGCLSWRPAWSTKAAPGQPGLLYRQTLCQKTKIKYIICSLKKLLYDLQNDSNLYSCQKAVAHGSLQIWGSPGLHGVVQCSLSNTVRSCLIKLSIVSWVMFQLLVIPLGNWPEEVLSSSRSVALQYWEPISTKGLKTCVWEYLLFL